MRFKPRIGVLFVAATLLAAQAFADPFQREKEFPNYFLSESARSALALGKHTPEVERETSEMHALLEKAMRSVFDRVTLPLVNPTTGKVESSRFFPTLAQELRAIDSTSNILPSGGVVRSVVSYIYDEIRRGIGQGISARSTLVRIASDTKDIAGIEVRGVGSDWDLLLVTDRKTASVGAIKNRVLEITNGAERVYEMRNEPGALKRSLFVIGDTKGYDEQILRSTSQGGSTIDFLAFDLKTGKFVEPSGHFGIVDDLIQGVYSYIGPVTQQAIEDSAKQTIRGARPLLELPFLRLKDDGILRKELLALIKSVDEGHPISPKAIDQFAKMVRNARYSGANNRFYRSPPDSIETLFLQLSQKLTPRKEAPLLPEFVDRYPFEGRTAAKAELNGIPPELLAPNHGMKVYHGTPSIDSGLAIQRQGLFLSKKGQGRAIFGRGVYSSRSFEFAQGYAGAEGIVFELEIKDDPRLNILDWSKAQNHPKIREIQASAAKGGLDVFEVLAREHGIDVILNTHVLIQNLEAVNFPDQTRMLVESYAHFVKRSDAPLSKRISSLQTYDRLHNYGIALGVRDLPDPRALKQALDIEVKSRVLELEKSVRDASMGPFLRVEAFNELRQLSSGGVPELPDLRNLEAELNASLFRLASDVQNPELSIPAFLYLKQTAWRIADRENIDKLVTKNLRALYDLVAKEGTGSLAEKGIDYFTEQSRSHHLIEDWVYRQDLSLDRDLLLRALRFESGEFKVSIARTLLRKDKADSAPILEEFERLYAGNEKKAAFEFLYELRGLKPELDSRFRQAAADFIFHPPSAEDEALYLDVLKMARHDLPVEREVRALFGRDLISNMPEKRQIAFSRLHDAWGLSEDESRIYVLLAEKKYDQAITELNRWKNGDPLLTCQRVLGPVDFGGDIAIDRYLASLLENPNHQRSAINFIRGMTFGPEQDEFWLKFIGQHPDMEDAYFIAQKFYAPWRKSELLMTPGFLKEASRQYEEGRPRFRGVLKQILQRRAQAGLRNQCLRKILGTVSPSN